MKKRNSMNLGRSFFGMLLIMAFMVIGTQQAEAQYMHPSEALSTLDQHVQQLSSTASAPQLTKVSASNSTQFKLEYVSGVVAALKENATVQAALDASYNGFLEKYPASTAVAGQLRTETTALLED